MGKGKTCGSEDCGCERKTHAFGTATWLAVGAAAMVVGLALWFSIKKPVAGPPPVTAIPKWYPEPAFLLQHDADLKLDAGQRRRAQVAAREWDIKKASFDVQLKSFDADSTKAMSDLTSHRSVTGGYARLLIKFDESRDKAWKRAIGKLEPEQILALDRLRAQALAPKKQ